MQSAALISETPASDDSMDEARARGLACAVAALARMTTAERETLRVEVEHAREVWNDPRVDSAVEAVARDLREVMRDLVGRGDCKGLEALLVGVLGLESVRQVLDLAAETRSAERP